MIPDIKIYNLSSITLKTLKDFITDKSLNEDLMILLNQRNLDQIIIEHLNEYGTSIEFPFFYLGIEIEEDMYNKVRFNEIGIIDSEKFNNIF